MSGNHSPSPRTAVNTTTIAGTAGRITGTTIRGLLWANEQIDWAEVRAIVLQGLQVAIVLTLLAGRATRQAWDALPALSAKLGAIYARLIVPAATVIKAAPMVHPLAELGQQLEQLSRRELQALAGTRQNTAKRQLVALLVAC